jgi:Arc/MetJ-type ribon-helix-helix transcriptional regulator
MSTTVTVRLDEALREALELEAKARRKTISEVIRDTLRESFDARPLGEKVGHLRGVLEIELDDDPWRRQIKERNWRP